MTTGSKSRFTMNLKIFKNGPNQLLSGDGRDSSGQFDIEDGLILGEACLKFFNFIPSGHLTKIQRITTPLQF